MKRCPECRKDYLDDSLLYCLDDGSPLVQGVVGEMQTAILPSGLVLDPATRAQIHTTDQTAVLPSGVTEVGRAKGFDKRLLLAPVVLAVIVLGGFFGYRNLSATGTINSVAVLPFANDSGNADVEYLSDGMTETLIKSLSGIPDMDVKPRSAVFRYKGKDTDIPTIGKELNVQAVLSGRVVQRGEQLSLNLELIDVQRNRVIWSEQYQRRQTDVVSLQSEIAKDVSAKLSPRLSGDEETKVSKQATTDPEAYQSYLRGRFLWNRRTGENLDKAVEQFQAAINRDPNYALAYAGLADVYSIYPDYSLNAPGDSWLRAESFAKRAVSLDGQLAEPHGTLGNVYYNRLQWADSEAEYKRAIELNPNYPTAYHWYAVLLFGLGRNDEGETAILKAYQLDPMSSIIGQNVSQLYRMKGDYKAAIETCQRIIDLDPNFPGCHFAIAWSYLKTGRSSEAISEWQKALELNGRYSSTLGELGFAFASTGKTSDAMSLLDELNKRFAKKQANGCDLAAIFAGLGDKDKAFEWLEKDVADRNARLAEFRWSEASEPLRDDQRFNAVIRRMGLTE